MIRGSKDLKKERNFAGHLVTFFFKSLIVKTKHTLILVNQLEASTTNQPIRSFKKWVSG